MPIANPPNAFITNPGSMLPYNTQARLIEEKKELNNNPQAIAIATKRLNDNERDSFVRIPCTLLQKGLSLQFSSRVFAFYMWLLGFANHLHWPKEDKENVYCDLDQWLRAGFVVTARRRRDIKKSIGLSASTVSRYARELEKAGFIKVVRNYKTGWYENINVYILGYRLRVKGTEATIWLAELVPVNSDSNTVPVNSDSKVPVNSDRSFNR